MNTPTLDLAFIDSHNLFTMWIADTSSYPTNYKYPSPYIEITPPGFDRVVLPFSPNGLFIINSANIELSCVGGALTELPDGIWEFKYSLAPTSTTFVEKKFLRVEQLKRKFQQLFLQVDIDECDGEVKCQDMEYVDKIEFLINGAIANANRCNTDLALKQYRLADRLIDNFKKTK